MPKTSEETVTSKVEDALRIATAKGEFLNLPMLVQVTGESYGNILRSLLHLKNHKVVFVVINADGVGWWAASPPEQDTRIRSYRKRAIEPEGNRLKRKKVIRSVSTL